MDRKNTTEDVIRSEWQRHDASYSEPCSMQQQPSHQQTIASEIR